MDPKPMTAKCMSEQCHIIHVKHFGMIPTHILAWDHWLTIYSNLRKDLHQNSSSLTPPQTFQLPRIDPASHQVWAQKKVTT